MTRMRMIGAGARKPRSRFGKPPVNTSPDSNAIALTRMTEAMTKAIDGRYGSLCALLRINCCAHEIMTSGLRDCSTRQKPTTPTTHSLLDFPIDFATLDSTDNDGDNHHDSDDGNIPHQKRRRLHKRWTDKDRQHLGKLR